MTRFVALLGLALTPLFPLAAAPVRIVGSDLLAESVGAELQAFAKNTDREIALSFTGSRLGLEALQKGQADFALVAFGPGDAQPPADFASPVIGYMTTAVVVPEALPLTQVSYPQLAGIFGASEINNYKRWSEVGVSGGWGVRGITAVATTRRAGLAIDLFRFGVLKTPEFKPTVLMFDDPAKAKARIGAEDGGIALLATPPPADSRLKVLLVAKTERDVAYGPTAENLHSGDYPLRLPIHLVLRRGSASQFTFVLRHLLSNEAAPALLKAGVVPLPVQARNQLVFDLETM